MLTTASIDKLACSPKVVGSRDTFYYCMTDKPDLSVSNNEFPKYRMLCENNKNRLYACKNTYHCCTVCYRSLTMHCLQLRIDNFAVSIAQLVAAMEQLSRISKQWL